MVLQVLAHAWQIGHLCDAVLCQRLLGSHARQQQQLRRIDGAAAQHDFTLGLDALAFAFALDLDPHGLFAREQDARDMGAGEHGQIRPVHDRVQECPSAAPAFPVLLGHLVRPCTFLLRSVEVHVARNAALHGGVDEAARQRVGRAHIGDVQWSICSVVGRDTALVILMFHKDRQQILVGPSGVSRCCPCVVISLVPAHVDHGIDRAAAPDCFSPRPVQATTFEFGLWFGVEIPVVLAGGEQAHEAHRRADQR